MEMRLIVNADDYGRTPGVSRGIRRAHRQGVVTSTTVMVNFPTAADDLRLARTECPALGLGLHLNLTAGRPLLPPDQLPGWVGPNGRFLRPERLSGRPGGLDPAGAEAEWRAQIEAFVAAVGSPPDHLDAHHHIAYLSEELFAVMLTLARAYDCAIRLPLAEDGAQAGLPAEWLTAMASFAPRLLTDFQPRRPDHFFASFYGPAATVGTLLRLIENLPPGCSEWMCHPGEADVQLLAESGYARERESELQALCDPRVRQALERRGVSLITFREL